MYDKIKIIPFFFLLHISMILSIYVIRKVGWRRGLEGSLVPQKEGRFSSICSVILFPIVYKNNYIHQNNGEIIFK